MKKRHFVLGGVAALSLLLAACGTPPPPAAANSSGNNSNGGNASGGGNGGNSSSTKSVGASLTIDNESGSLWTCGFNPFDPSVSFVSGGFMYEPLVFVDALENSKTTPMLATSYAWSNHNKTLTFKIRQGVKWNDGTPFSAADVAYTFNLLKKYRGLDLNAVWSVLHSVVQRGDDVVMTFKSEAVPDFYYIADQVPIIPEHIWSKVGNPVTFKDPHPVATGPMTISSCTPQNIEYTANSHYWQPGLPKVRTMNYPAFTSNTPANTYLSTGKAQWGGQFIPNVKAFYTDKSPNYHYWYPLSSNVYLFPNLKDPQLDDLQVRRAMSYAVDRHQVSSVALYGYEPPANQAGIVTPTFSSWLDKSQLSHYGYTYDTKKAISILEADGYKKGSNGIFEKDGKKLSFNVINVGGNTDWVAALQIIQQEFKAAGIGLTADELSGNDYDNDLYNGRFQLAWGGENGGPSPYYELRQVLFSGNTAPIGKAASTNWERYSNPSTDALFRAYDATTSTATQHKIVDSLQKVMLSDVPVIPVTEGAEWYQYDTTDFTGWETSANPFAIPAPYAIPDNEQVLLHLRPK